MVFVKKKNGQAAIEFLMTYGWMLLVVLIVGALIFSFVDFGSLLPNKLELSNNLRGDATGSVAYSGSTAQSSLQNQVKVVFRFNGAKRALIAPDNAVIDTELGETCTADNLTNLDTQSSVGSGSSLPFLNGQDGLINFDCDPLSDDLLSGDSLVGDIRIYVTDPKTSLEIPSTGSLRLQISD